MKRLTIFTATLVASTAILLSPTAATAAPLVPDGSAPYGADTICNFSGDVALSDASESTCSPLPTEQWTDVDLPTMGNGTTNTDWGKISTLGNVNSEGTITDSPDGGYSDLFVVAPTEPSQLPLLATAELDVYGHNPDVVEITGVEAWVVADSRPEAFYGTESGRANQIIDSGKGYPVSLELNADGKYNADFTIPSPTWEQRTDGVLNAYGYFGYLKTVVSMTVDGQPEQYVNNYYFDLASPYLADITNFSAETVCADGEVCGSGGGYTIIGNWGVSSPTYPPTTPTPPPAPVPPAVSPPTVPPVVTDTPEDGSGDPEEPEVIKEPEHPRVNTGSADSAPLYGFGLGGLFAAAFGALMIARTRNQEDEG